MVFGAFRFMRELMRQGRKDRPLRGIDDYPAVGRDVSIEALRKPLANVDVDSKILNNKKSSRHSTT